MIWPVMPVRLRANATPIATPTSEPISPATALSARNSVRICARVAPERAQDADLRPPLRDRDRERVVDDEHPDEQREQAGDLQRQRVDAEHRLEIARRGRRAAPP